MPGLRARGPRGWQQLESRSSGARRCCRIGLPVPMLEPAPSGADPHTFAPENAYAAPIFYMVPRWDSPKRTRWCSFRTEGHHLGETRARVRHEWTSTRHRVDVRRVRNGPNECDVRTSRRDECPRIGPAGAKWIVPGSTDQTGRRRQMGPSETSWAAGDKLGRPRGHTPDGAATACGQRPASIPRRHAQRESAMFQHTLWACQ